MLDYDIVMDYILTASIQLLSVGQQINLITIAALHMAQKLRINKSEEKGIYFFMFKQLL